MVERLGRKGHLGVGRLLRGPLAPGPQLRAAALGQHGYYLWGWARYTG